VKQSQSDMNVRFLELMDAANMENFAQVSDVSRVPRGTLYGIAKTPGRRPNRMTRFRLSRALKCEVSSLDWRR